MRVEDPTLFVFAFFDRHLPGHVEHDPREAYRAILGGLERSYDLTTAVAGARTEEARDLNLKDVARVDDAFIPWVNRLRKGPGENELRQALAYTFGDTLYLHSIDSRGKTSWDFLDAWRSLTTGPVDILRGVDWNAASGGFWGLSLCFSTLIPDEQFAELEDTAVRPLVSAACAGPAMRADAKVGQLWLVRSDWMGLAGGREELQATWILFSPKSAERELKDVLHSLRGTTGAPIPPPLPLLFQARQKFFVQVTEYDRSRGDLQATKVSLDERMAKLLEAQRDLEDQSKVIYSDEAEEIRGKATRAHNNLAAFARAVSRVSDVQSTLAINLRNHEEGWQRLRARDGVDEIFDAEHGYLQRRAQQVAYDASYFRELLERARATLDAAQARFNIASERGQSHGVRHAVTQVSGLVASLIALVVTTVLGFSDFPSRRPLLAGNLILLALFGSFALSQLLIAWGQVRTSLTRFSLAIAAGILLSTLLALPGEQPWWLWFGVPASIVVAIGTYVLVRYLEEKPRLEHEPAWRRRQGFTSAIEKVRDANEELGDLLDDLPPTSYFRLKKDASFLEKIQRKRRQRAEESGRSVEEIAGEQRAYSEFNVGDPIGIRYVVSPWELPLTVDRIKRALGRKVAGSPDYKTGRYKSVHIDVDLWGVGAGHELMAEIQVRTHLQHFYADSVHDVIYKDVPDSGSRVLRGLKRSALTRWTLPFWDRLLALPSAIEFALFRRWMRWERWPGTEGHRDV